MGGVLSSVSDLARWVAGFAAAFPPDGSREGNAAADGHAPHPLRPASRREMQLPQAVTGWRAADRLPGGPPAAPAYYGFGLFADEDPGLGRIVSHSGGYPGFGTNMRWHPATGVGVIALANGTYAPMTGLTALVLDALLPSSSAYHVALAPRRRARRAGRGRPGRKRWPPQKRSIASCWPGTTSVADALFTRTSRSTAPTLSAATPSGGSASASATSPPKGQRGRRVRREDRVRPSPIPRRTAAGG